MCICTSCGFVTYPDRVSDKDKMKKYYEKDYRHPPNINNLYTGERKLHYHHAFLQEPLSKWKDTEVEVLEEGAAFGMFLDWLRRSLLPKASLNGTELTQSFVRNAYYEYNIRLKDKVDTSKKYDLICSYKVAEHQPEIDKVLKGYVDILKDDGYVYISVPTWFETMTNFGVGGFDLEYYYHPDHINVWTKKLFEGLLSKVGLKVIKENHTFYDNTYLCVKDKPGAIYKEDPKAIEEKMGHIKNAAESFLLHDFDKAIEHFPNFPHAYMNMYEAQRKKLHEKGVEHIKKEFLTKAIKNCPDNGDIEVFAADICGRYKQYEDTFKHLDSSLKLKANNVQSLMLMGSTFIKMAKTEKDPEKSVKLWKEGRNVFGFVSTISSQQRPEATTWKMFCNAQIPIPDEDQTR